MTTDLKKLESQGIVLNQREKSALELYENGPDAGIGLSPRPIADFFALYLQGYGLEEIQRANPGFKLGILVKARIDNEWDRLKREYIETLMLSTRETVLKAQLEAVRFAADGMVVHQKLLGDAFRKYLQTGNEADLGSHKDQINIRNYKEYASLFMQLTGQDKKAQVSGDLTIKSEPNGVTEKDVATIDGAILLQSMDTKK